MLVGKKCTVRIVVAMASSLYSYQRDFSFVMAAPYLHCSIFYVTLCLFATLRSTVLMSVYPWRNNFTVFFQVG